MNVVKAIEIRAVHAMARAVKAASVGELIAAVKGLLIKLYDAGGQRLYDADGEELFVKG